MVESGLIYSINDTGCLQLFLFKLSKKFLDAPLGALQPGTLNVEPVNLGLIYFESTKYFSRLIRNSGVGVPSEAM